MGGTMMMGLRFIWMSKFFFFRLAVTMEWSCEFEDLLTVDDSAEAKPLVYEHATAVKRLNK
jgi:hypothetical protein